MDPCARCGGVHVAGDGLWRLVDGDPVCPGCLRPDEFGAEPFDPAASPIDHYVATIRGGLPLRWWARRTVASEVRQHLKEAALDAQAAGLTGWRAERAAVQSFGSVERLAAEYTRRPKARWKRYGVPAAAVVAAAGLAVALLGFGPLGGRAGSPPAGSPPVGHPIAGVRLLPASPERVALLGPNKITCTRLRIVLARPAAAVRLMIYPEGGRQWVRLLTHHQALPGRTLDFPAWCGRARAPLKTGVYLWRYEVRWKPGARWQLPPLQRIVIAREVAT